MSEIQKNPEYPTELEYRRFLDHGFVALIDVMGDDASIVQAARVSYGKGTKTMRSDKALISYLMRHAHTTPFEMVEFKFLMRMPVFIARQVIRHRTASVNEYSARYSEVPDRFWVPALGAIAEQDNVNRQGRLDKLRDLARRLPAHASGATCKYHDGAVAVLVARDGTGICGHALSDVDARSDFVSHWRGDDEAKAWLPTEEYAYWVEELLEHFPAEKEKLANVQARIREANESAYALYRQLLEDGVARELARGVLPLTMYTEWYWKIDLHNLFHFLRLRMDAHAQYEVRALAEAMAGFVAPRVPAAWEAFYNDRAQGTFLSKAEREVLRPLDAAAQTEVLRGLHERGYRSRRLKEVCRKLGMEENMVDELWPPK